MLALGSLHCLDFNKAPGRTPGLGPGSSALGLQREGQSVLQSEEQKKEASLSFNLFQPCFAAILPMQLLYSPLLPLESENVRLWMPLCLS